MRKIPRKQHFLVWRRLVAGAVCLVLTGYLFATQIPILWRCLRSGSYVETTGQITSPPRIDSSIGSFVRGVLLLGDRTEVVVEYTYEVNGRAFTGTRIFEHGNTVFGTGARGSYVPSSPAGRLIEELTERPTVSVYYDPSDPATAILERDSVRGTVFGIIWTVVGLAIAAFGLVLFKAGVQRRHVSSSGGGDAPSGRRTPRPR